MTDVIELDSDTWSVKHNFYTTLNQRLGLPNSTSVFNVTGQLCFSKCWFVQLTVRPEKDGPISYAIEYKAQNGNLTEEGKITKAKETCLPLKFDGKMKNSDLTVSLELRFIHVDIVSIGELFCPLKADLKSFIDRGPTVRLVGNDGNVIVPKRILKLRSKAMEAMFGHDSKESRTGEIELEDFDVKTLEAFAQFLMTGEITDGKDTALGLILLGDKYDIQAMKSTAENYVKRNIKRMNEEEVIDIFSKVSRKSLYGAMVDSWAKE